MKKIYEKLHYKNGENISHAEHLRTMEWHRGVRITNISRKKFTCVFGCNIPKGSSYVTMAILAGSGRADSMIDFALCNLHQSATEAISGDLKTTKLSPYEIIKIWISLINNRNSTQVLSEFNVELDSQQGVLTEEIVDAEKYFEGATKTICVNAYERSNKARRDCTNAHGYACVVCKFDFEIEYGDIGKNFIHVHHLKQLADIGEEYEINPREDLRPVCPNCHAMLHKRRPAYSIEELREIIDVANKHRRRNTPHR